jgi:hypothetical protein
MGQLIQHHTLFCKVPYYVPHFEKEGSSGFSFWTNLTGKVREAIGGTFGTI